MKKVLVLCHGNRYRSPLCAAELIRLGGLDVRSAGFAKSGLRAAKKMRDAAGENALNLQTHRSQTITRELVLWANVVVYMDRGNLQRLLELMEPIRRADQPGIVCLGSYCSPSRLRIPDPAYMRRGSREFAEVVPMILTATRRLHKEFTA